MKQLFQANKILNVYKLNIWNVATFMYKVNLKNIANVFLSRFQKPYHFYPTKFSELNHIKPIHDIKTSKYWFSVRGPYIWNSFLSPEEKQITTMHKFRAVTKSKLHFLENELEIFLERAFSIHQALWELNSLKLLSFFMIISSIKVLTLV